MSYKVDYIVNSTTAPGGTSAGTIYIRGLKTPQGDSFKFILEKSVDFSELDAQVMITVLQEMNRMFPPAMPEPAAQNRRFDNKKDT